MIDDTCQYLRFFTLNSEPFHGLKDPRFVWLGQKQLETLAHLKNGVEQRKGICLLTGKDGTGKSVLVDRLVRNLPKDTLTAVLRVPGLNVNQFEQLLSKQLGLPPTETRGDFQKGVKAFLEEKYLSGRYVLLVLEEADSAEDEVLEQVRLLSNLETPDHEKLVNILVTGNGRLEERLSSYERRALQQRVEIQRSISPFTDKETEAYIRHRLMVAGAFLEIFTTDAIERIHHFSGGIPKLIDIICDHALKRACIEKRRKVDGEMIDGFAKEIRATSPLAQSFVADERRPKTRLSNSQF